MRHDWRAIRAAAAYGQGPGKPAAAAAVDDATLGVDGPRLPIHYPNSRDFPVNAGKDS
jgi:hypothetical protein